MPLWRQAWMVVGAWRATEMNDHRLNALWANWPNHREHPWMQWKIKSETPELANEIDEWIKFATPSAIGNHLGYENDHVGQVDWTSLNLET